MPLSIFADALPYTEMCANYGKWFENMQIAELQPNIGYSSCLHWQLYCDKYPDDRGAFVDWGMSSEKNRSIRMIASCLTPFDSCGAIGLIAKKILDRIVFRRYAFANLPFKFRKSFTVVGNYLFSDRMLYGNEPIFHGYEVVSQDEGRITFADALDRLNQAVKQKKRNIMFVTGFPDVVGHKNRRGERYSMCLSGYMDALQKAIQYYMDVFPDEEVLLLSDHGMSTIERRVDLELEKVFGKQNKQTYVAYMDSCIMCVWSVNKATIDGISDYLLTRKEGHLLTETEREYYRVTDRKFGDLIYILKEGACFSNSWFGKSLKRPRKEGSGMHGFWPERKARDQMACVVLINGRRNLKEFYTYREAHSLISNVMQG